MNKLGTFTNTYVGVTNRLSKVLNPGGSSANYLYFPNAQDKRLQQIKNINNNLNANKQLISQFDYTYDIEGEITTWTKNYAGLAAPQRFDLGYDGAIIPRISTEYLLCNLVKADAGRRGFALI